MPRIATKLLAPKDFPYKTPLKLDVDPRAGNVDVVEGSARFAAGANTGLLWQRYMPPHDKSTTLRSPGGVNIELDSDTQKSSSLGSFWAGFGAMKWFADHANREWNSAGTRAWLSRLHERKRLAAGAGAPSCNLTMRVLWRLAIGQALTSTFENSGIALHHTYGFPYIPGSSLKGLLRHYMQEELEQEVLVNLGNRYKAARAAGGQQTPPEHVLDFLFGGQSGDAESATSREGAIVFHDAWPLPSANPWFEVDVGTVHYSDYYSGKGQLPDDTQPPKPNHFLSLSSGTSFEIALGMNEQALEVEESNSLLFEIRNLLVDALGILGIGAKTGSGYGCLIEEPHDA